MIQAKGVRRGVYLEDLCFRLNRLWRKLSRRFSCIVEHLFPYAHDIARLVGILEQEGERVPHRVHRAAILNGYAVDARVFLNL